MMPPFVEIALVLVVLACLLLGIRTAQSRSKWHPEISRKAVHVAMGMVCLTFPWLFKEAWPVWVLAVAAMVALAGIRSMPVLSRNMGHVLGGVQRQSWGELLFPMAVAFVFWLSRENPLLFCIPILILSLADALAALIGQRYGFGAYETDDGWKSFEGSVAFFLVAFLSTHIPLLLASDIGRLECLLIATAMGLILMLLEAISWRGLDNLFVPLISYVCLVRMADLGSAALFTRLAVLVVLLVSLKVWHKTTRLTQSAAIGSALVLYVAWAVGDAHWLIAPLVVALAYTFLCHRSATAPQRHTVHAIACIGGVGLVWLCLSQILGTVNTIYPYGVGYGANLGMIALAYFADAAHPQPKWLAISKAVLLGYVPLAAPYLLVWRENPNALQLAIAALVMLLLAILAFALWQPTLQACPADAARWTRQGIISAFASLIAFAFVSAIEPWSKSFL
jgi:phytol kinase